MTKSTAQLAVLGSPISHSKSPALHSAAYKVLGLDWGYSAHEVKSGELRGFLSDTRSQWHGLSLTMPLKREVVPLLDEQDAVSLRVGAVNTVLFDAGTLLGFNTDVYGAERMLREAFPHELRRALILGGGATARSVALALAHCGVTEMTFALRSPAARHDALVFGDSIGVAVTVADFGNISGDFDVAVSTLPGTAELSHSLPRALRESVPLADIAYSPWPTTVAQHWLDVDGGVLNNGIGMLIYQAIAQVRIFVNGNPSLELPKEEKVLAAMRRTAFGIT